MSESTTEIEPGPFTQKNADRRRNRDMVGIHRYRDARRMRRRYTIGGAFGRQPFLKLWNDLIVGTNGEPRVIRGES